MGTYTGSRPVKRNSTVRETEKEELLVLCNFKGQEVSYELPDIWKDQEVLISNYAQEGSFGTLRPYEAKMIIIRKGE